MKAEINKENKARFFALYWAQQVIEVETYKNLKSPYVSFLVTDEYNLNAVIQLKSLSEISDEDSIEVACICQVNEQRHPEIGKAIVWSVVKKYIPHPDLMWHVIDYLRSRGYALPWMGLSVDEMVKSGWIKLI